MLVVLSLLLSRDISTSTDTETHHHHQLKLETAGLLGCWCFFNTNILELELGVLVVISDDE